MRGGGGGGVGLSFGAYFTRFPPPLYWFLVENLKYPLNHVTRRLMRFAFRVTSRYSGTNLGGEVRDFVSVCLFCLFSSSGCNI